MTDVLYISYDGMTDPLGMSQVLPYLTELSKHQFRFHLISFEKPDAKERLKEEIISITKKAGIVWYPLSYHKNPPVLSTVYDLTRMSRKAKQICDEHPVKIIHCRSYLAAMIGRPICKEKGIKMLFDMRGFWADERVEGGIWNLKNPLYSAIYKFFKRKEKDLLRKADAIISLTSKGKDIIEQRFGKQVSNHITVIPCCADLRHFSAGSVKEELRTRFRTELGITNEDKVLTYVGSLGTWYMMDEMLDFFKVSLEKKVFTKFLVITRDNASGLFESARKKSIPEASICVRPADRSELPSLMDLGTWSLFFIRPSFSKSASSPTKMGELLGMGRGIIANKGVGDNDILFTKYHPGLLVDDFSIRSYSKVLDQLKECNIEENRRAAEDYFSLEKGVSSYLEVYKDLLSRNHS